MSTNIDSLSIEIQSNSTNAAKGIDDLAASLGNLKSNGSLGVAVKNLERLSDALKKLTPVTSNAKKLDDLAKSVSNLANVGSISKTVNQLSKLPGALNGLSKVNIDPELGRKLSDLATAVAPLSNVKTSGFNSMVSSLSKIGKVTDSLDDDTIAQFTERVKKLNDALTPLSSKMTTIQSGLRGMNSATNNGASGVKNLGSKVNVTTMNLANMITVVRGVIDALRPIIRLLSSTISAAMEWDGIAQRFGRGFGDSAEETYAWIQRLNKEMGINVQQFMQYSSVYATMLSGFGVAIEDAGKMALGYTELTYDIWAGYNDVYKRFGDAAEAVKSAIAGEVEPIRRAGFTIVESTLEQTAANHGLEISLEKATEAQKSYLRYLTLVDQAHAQGLVGTYAREMNTAEGVVRTFSQQLKSLAQTFGSLFLPILTKVIPWLQAFVELLTEAIVAVAALFGVEIQPVDFSGFGGGSTALEGVGDAADSATDSLGNAADGVDDVTKAIKDLQKATIGIDELNVISPPTDSGSSGSGGSGGSGGSAGAGGSGFDGLDIDSLWDESIFDQIQSQVDEIKEKISDWLPIIEAVALALGALTVAKLLSDMGKALSQMDKLTGAIAGVAVATIEAALVFVFADNYLESGNLWALVGEAVATAMGSYLLYKTWGAKGLVVGMAVSIVAQLAAITLNLASGDVEMSDPQLWVQSAFTSALAGATGGWMAYKGLIPMSTGQGIGIGLLAGLSLTLAAITIGDISADGLEFQNVLTGILSTLIGGAAGASIFTALGVASGGAGFLVGAAIMLAVNVIGALIGSVSKEAETSVQEDLESRFGNVELSVSEARVLIEKLSPEWVEGVNYAVQLRKGVENMLKTIEAQEGSLGSLEWQVSVGIGLTESENTEYRKLIDSFVSSCQEYVAQRGYAVEVGLKATTTNESIIESANSVSSMAATELQTLGKKLQDTVNSAYEDGLLDIDELEAIQTIRNDMREIVNALSGSEVQAEFDTLELKWSGVELTPDSYETMLSEWNDTIENKVKPALESTVKENLKTLEGNVAYLKMALEKDPDNTQLQKDLAAAEKALQDYIDENPLEKLTLEAKVEQVNFALNTLREAFAKEIENVEKNGYLESDNALEFTLSVNPNIKFDDGNGDVYGNVAALFQPMQSEMLAARDSLSKEARANLEAMIENLKPTMEDFESIAAEHRKVGTAVPQSVRDGLNDYNELKALSGDLDGINYMIGAGFSTDPTFLNTLATVKGAGADVPDAMAEGLLNNLEVVKNAADGTVTFMADGVEVGTYNVTPELVENMESLGVDLGDGLLAGAESGMESNKKSWRDWAIWPWNWFKEENEINSPSKLFERGGKYLTDGLVNGMETDSLKNKLSTIWNTAKEWWNGTTPLQKVEAAVSLVKSGWDTVAGWIGKIPGVSQAVSLAKDGWSTVKDFAENTTRTAYAKIKLAKDETFTNIKDFVEKTKRTAYSKIKLAKDTTFTTIKDFVEKTKRTAYSKIKLSKDGWKNVKEYVEGTTRTASAKIKLVKDGWKTVKGWLGGLSYKLSLGLPKIKVTWGEKTYAGFTIRYPNGFSTYAKGGFPDMGEMFIANEKTGVPEMIGRIGSKTTVANNDQIVEAVSEGVYAAVLAAMKASESGGGQSVNVYLDGRQITSAVERRQHERGASLMGKQVYAY